MVVTEKAMGGFISKLNYTEERATGVKGDYYAHGTRILVKRGQGEYKVKGNKNRTAFKPEENKYNRDYGYFEKRGWIISSLVMLVVLAMVRSAFAYHSRDTGEDGGKSESKILHSNKELWIFGIIIVLAIVVHVVMLLDVYLDATMKTKHRRTSAPM